MKFSSDRAEPAAVRAYLAKTSVAHTADGTRCFTSEGSSQQVLRKSAQNSYEGALQPCCVKRRDSWRQGEDVNVGLAVNKRCFLRVRTGVLPRGLRNWIFFSYWCYYQLIASAAESINCFPVISAAVCEHLPTATGILELPALMYKDGNAALQHRTAPAACHG